jgi:hypothetical protein
MSKEQWKQLKDKEKNNSKNLGKVGITKFQSRSMSEWQKAGGKNLFPVDPKSVKSKKDLPYVSISLSEKSESLPFPICSNMNGFLRFDAVCSNLYDIQYR